MQNRIKNYVAIKKIVFLEMKNDGREELCFARLIAPAVISNFRTELQNEKRMKNFAIFVKWKKEK